MPKHSFAKAIAKIVPTEEEVRSERRLASTIIRRLQDQSPKWCRVVLAGSVAKGTFMRGSNDLDIFILFEKRIERENLESGIRNIMEKAFPKTGFQLSYAEHPYLRFHYQGRRVDLVPAYDIKDTKERKSAVDRSVHHTKYIKNNLPKDKRKDVILLKSFLKSYSLYGAEIKIKGFSGYLCELLIISYGSFMKLMTAASKWKLPIFLDPADHYKNTDCPPFFETPLILVDPTDKKRNVAAALSCRNLLRFIRLSKRLIKTMNPDMITRAPRTFRQKVSSAKRNNHLYMVSMPKPDVVDDILWGQLHKLMHQLKKHLSDFKPGNIFADDSEGIRIAIPLKEDLLPKTEDVQGPPLDMKDHIKKFKNSHKDAAFLRRNGRLIARRNRKIRSAEDAILEFLKKYEKSASHLSGPTNKIKISK